MAAEHLADAGMASDAVVPRDFAIVSRSGALNVSPTGFIFPTSSAERIVCHDICRSVSGSGAPTEFPAAWQLAHLAWNSASGLCARINIKSKCMRGL